MTLYEQDSNESLMVRIAGGDHQAFATLVRRNTRLFYAAAYRMCGNVEEAEDIVQEAFLKLWNKPGLWDASRGAKFTTWFYRVVTNMATDSLRRRKPQADNAVLDRMTDNAAAQDTAMFAEQEQAAIESAIQALPDRQKAALNLCFYEGLSNKEAAAVMGVGVKALESLLMRAKASMKDTLLRQGIIDREKEYG